MIYNPKSKTNDFYIAELAIDGKIIYTSDLLTESKGKSGAIGFNTDIYVSKRITKPIRLNVLTREVGHEPRVKVSSIDDSIDMFNFPIYRNTGDINDEKIDNIKISNPYNLDYNDTKDFVQDFSRSCLKQIMQYFNNESDSNTADIIRSRLKNLSKCRSTDDRKKLVEEFMKEDGR